MYMLHHFYIANELGSMDKLLQITDINSLTEMCRGTKLQKLNKKRLLPNTSLAKRYSTSVWKSCQRKLLIQ